MRENHVPIIITEAENFQRGAKLRQIIVTAKLFQINFFLTSHF